VTLTFSSFDGAWWPYLFIAIAGILANDIWRVLGVLLSGRISERSEAFVFVKAIASALVASVIAEIVFFPSGALATTPLWLRLATMGVGIAVYQTTRRNLGAGILAGEAIFIAGAWWLG
jgi:hypothetical protein